MISNRYNELNTQFKIGKINVQLGVGWFVIGIIVKFAFPSVTPIFVIITTVIGVAVFCIGVYKMRHASHQLQKHVLSERERTTVSVIYSNRHTMGSNGFISSGDPTIVTKPPDYESPPEYEEAVVGATNLAVDKTCSVNDCSQHSN